MRVNLGNLNCRQGHEGDNHPILLALGTIIANLAHSPLSLPGLPAENNKYGPE